MPCLLLDYILKLLVLYLVPRFKLAHALLHGVMSGPPPPDLRYFLALLSTFFLFLVMGKDRLVLDVTSDDRRRAFKYFVANFCDFCTMDDFVNLVDRQKINYLSSSYLQLSQRYLGEEPTIQGTHNFLCQLKQDPGISIQDWHTLVYLEYQKSNLPSAVDNHLITRHFFHWLNDTLMHMHFRSDITSRENLSTLTFSQLILFAISKQHLEEN